MKRIFIYIIFLNLLFCNAQTKDSLLKRFSIGLSYEANIGYRQLHYDASDKWVEDIRNIEEIPRYGFVLGLNLIYQLNSKFSIETGVLIANKGMSTQKKDLTWDTPNPAYPIKSKTAYSFYYTEIPLKVNYSMKVGKLNTYLIGGFSMNNFISKETIITKYYKDNNKSKNSDRQNLWHKPIAFSILLGFGIQVPISKQLRLHLEPVYRQNFTSIVPHINGKEYLYSIGLNTKVFYNFRSKNK